MGERAKVILNEYSAKELLKRDTLDLDKFYTSDLKLFIETARKEIERLNNIIQNTIKKCVYLLENNEIEINTKNIINKNVTILLQRLF